MSWHAVFRKWRWEERAAAWDNEQRSLELEKWKQRRQELREQEWEIAIAGINKSKTMLNFPLSRVTKDNGQTIIEPARWSFRDAIAILVESSTLARKAAQMSTMTEAEALQVLVDLGVLPPEVTRIGTEALQQATAIILEAIARSGSQSTRND